ncbi:MAG: hypothetical protein ABR511_07175 [Acidimicrobiales bacterium]
MGSQEASHARSAVTATSVNDIRARQRAFERSPGGPPFPHHRHHRSTYREAIDELAAFLERSGMPTTMAAIRCERVEAFMEELNARSRPAAGSSRVWALQQFFKFAVGEEEIERPPLERWAT